MDEKKYTGYFFLLLGLSFTVRLLIASFYGLTGDEAHYYQYAVHPGLSYFDHPPLVGYAIWPFLKMFGNTSLAVRMPALICSTLCMWLLFIMGKNFYSVSSGFWAAAIFCMIPLFSVLGGIMTVPDTLVSVFWLLSIITIWKIYLTGKLYLWYLLGFFVGISLLAKYSGVLLYPAILLFMIINPQMHGYFKKKQVYLGFAISLIIFSPVLVWNYNNHWVSFVFQFKHGFGEKAFFNISLFTQNIIAQMAVISPLIWVMIFFCLFEIIKKTFKSSDMLNRLFFSFSFPVFAVFGYASLSNEILPHWPAAGYLTLILPCASFITEGLHSSMRRRKIFIKVALVIGIIFTSVIPVQIFFRCFSIPTQMDPTVDLYGWDSAANFVEYLYNKYGPETFLFTHKFYLASHLAFYLSQDIASEHLFCLSKRIDQYDFWQKDRNLRSYLNGKTGIFFTDEHFKYFPGEAYVFEKIENPLQLDIYYRNKKVKSFYFYKCVGFKTFKTDERYFDSRPFNQRNFFRDLVTLDNKTFLFLNRIAEKNRWLANLLFRIGLLGSTEIAILIVSIVLFLAKRESFLKYLGTFFLALSISACLVHVLKETFSSSRPVAYFSQEQVIHVTGPVLKSGSFPSGHAQTSFLTAAFLSWLFPKYGLFFFFIAIIIAFSRVFSGVHFFRDIIAGGFIGLLVFWFTMRLKELLNFFKRGNEQQFDKNK
ncbi:MAG: glycosyltransferase family 39 protein [bacterium]|nr:glycosyltransferase family 39 protein [bacterium]